MTVHGSGLLSTGRQSRAHWADAMASACNGLLARLIFEIAFAVRFRELPLGTTQARSKSEDIMVAKGTLAGDPRSKAAEFSQCLAEIASSRNELAFDVLFRYFAPRIKSYCLRLGADAAAAEDITQEAMVLVWRRADQFDPSKASPATWIFTIARNLSIDRFRKSRRPQIDPDDPALVPDDPLSPDRLVERTQLEDNVRTIMDSLSVNERNVLMLSLYEDLSHFEISRRLSLPVGTVKSRIRLAFAKIRSIFDAQDGAGT